MPKTIHVYSMTDDWRQHWEVDPSLVTPAQWDFANSVSHDQASMGFAIQGKYTAGFREINAAMLGMLRVQERADSKEIAAAIAIEEAGRTNQVTGESIDRIVGMVVATPDATLMHRHPRRRQWSEPDFGPVTRVEMVVGDTIESRVTVAQLLTAQVVETADELFEVGHFAVLAPVFRNPPEQFTELTAGISPYIGRKVGVGHYAWADNLPLIRSLRPPAEVLLSPNHI